MIRTKTIACMLVLGLACCKTRGVPGSEPHTVAMSDTTSSAEVHSGSLEPGGNAELAPEGCGTLRTLDVPDVLRVDGDRAYYLRADTGLSIFDLSEVDRPRVVSTSEIVGTSIGVFTSPSVVYAVVVAQDAIGGEPPPHTVVRALDVRDPAHPKRIGRDLVLRGNATDARFEAGQRGGALYVLRHAADGTTLDSIALRDGALAVVDRVVTSGTQSALAGIPGALTVITTNADAKTGSSTATWIDTHADGTLARRSSVVIAGQFPAWEQPKRLADLDDGRRLVMLTCWGTCTPTDGAQLAVVDFTDPDAPRMRPVARLPGARGVPVARFVAGALLYASVREAGSANGERASDLVALRIPDDGPPVETSRIVLRGDPSAILARGDGHAVVVAHAGRHAHASVALHDVAVSGGRLRKSGSVVIGRDWTWTPLFDDERAASFDPTSRFMALPFTALSEADGTYAMSTEVVGFGERGPKGVRTIDEGAFQDRVVFAKGRLYTFGSGGVEVFDPVARPSAPPLP